MPTTLRIVKPKPTFDVDGFLRSGSAGTTVAVYQPREIVFSQGDASDSVMYLQEGAVKLSVLSHSGQEAVVAMLETGAFFGESALVGDPVRHEAATAMTAITVLIIQKEQMIRLFHERHEFSDRFIAHMLARSIRIEEDVVDQLFNSSEKRLARALLLLGHFGKPGKAHRVLPAITQQTLAGVVGTTRSRVNFFNEQVQETRLHRIQRWREGQRLPRDSHLAGRTCRNTPVEDWVNAGRVSRFKTSSERTVDIETADKLTDPTIVAKVKEHFRIDR